MKTTRRRRNSKNKSQKKTKIGGKINNAVENPPRINATIEIPPTEIDYAKSLLSEDVEKCGKYVADNLNTPTIILRRDRDIYSGHRSQRASCDIINKDLYSVIWHTHPNTSKYYPSRQDIIMVKKLRNGEQIKLSVIYTSIGIWLLESLDSTTDIEQLHKIGKKIDKINKEFYGNCFKGRITTPGFDLNPVLDYIRFEYADAMYNECNMNILFLPYTEIYGQPILFNLTDVRIDSLTP